MSRFKFFPHWQSATVIIWCVGLIVMSQLIGERAGAAGQQCKPGPGVICPRPTPTPNRRRRRGTTPGNAAPENINKHPPSTLYNRNPKTGPEIGYDNVVSGKLDWGNEQTTGGYEPSKGSGSFTVYNEYLLDAKRSDLFMIQLQVPDPEAWKVDLFDLNNRQIETTLFNRLTGEFTPNTADRKVPSDGKYSVRVQRLGVPALNTSISLPYALLIARILPIDLDQKVERDISSQSSRRIRLASNQYTYFKEYTLKVAKTEVVNIQLQPEYLNVQIFDPSNRPLSLKPRGGETKGIELGTPGSVLPAEGEYRVRVQYENVSAQLAATPFILRFAPTKLSLPDYLARLEQIRREYQNGKQCGVAIQRLEELTGKNPDEPQAYEVMGKIGMECGRFDLARPALERTFNSGGPWAIDVLHQQDCAKEIIISKIDLKNLDPRLRMVTTSLVIQKGKLEVKAKNGGPTCNSLDKSQVEARKKGVPLQVYRSQNTSMIEIRGSGKTYYFLPYGVGYDDAVRIKYADLIVELINKYVNQR